MKTKIISTAVIAAFSMALAVNAAEGEKKKGGGFAALDTDKDGSVSKKEYMASPAAQKDSGKAENRFKTLDKNNDGKISKEEYMASPNAQKDTGKAEARFKSLDKDNNGSLSKEEFEAGQKKKN